MIKVVPSSHLEVASISRDYRAITARLVVLLASLLLLFAAGMKWRQLPVVERMGDDLLHRPWFVGGQIVFEAGLAAWLISGLGAKWSRRVAVAAFGIFAVVALYEALSGADSCGCFGEFKVNPWVTFGVDLTIVAAFAWSMMIVSVKPSGGTNKSMHRIQRGAVLGASLIAIVSLTLWRFHQSQPLASSSDGLITADGVVVLEPEGWIGKPFGLARYIDIGQRIIHGRWTVVLYSDGCDHCQRAVPRYEAFARQNRLKPNVPAVALVEMPPYAPPGQALAGPGSPAVVGRLSDAHEWFAETPVRIDLIDGRVITAAEGKEAEFPDVRIARAR